MSQNFRRLSEQDLAQLYLQTEAPLRLDDLLQSHLNGARGGDAAQIAVHDAISGQTPDLALVSLSLCGMIVARDYPETLKDGPMGPVLRELGLCAEDNLVTVGRLWLDQAINGIAPDPKEGRKIIESIPDRLRILISIFMEMHEALSEVPGTEVMQRAVACLYYQAESHADLADRFVADLATARKKARAAKAAAARRNVPDQIPLPFGLDRPREGGAEIVSFSLFREKAPV